MATADLSHVTETLRRLLSVNIERLDGAAVSVTAGYNA